jgi:acetyl-CoA carboxylase carboxyltransferase component
MSNLEQEEYEKIAGRFNVAPEMVETVLRARHAATMAEKLKSFANEREILLTGDREKIDELHSTGKLSARERAQRLFDEGSFEELDYWHRPLETDFDRGEAEGRGDGVVIGFGAVNRRAATIWAQDRMVRGGTLGTVHARKITMIMESGLRRRTPIVEIYDSQGIRAQDAVQYPDFYSPSSIAYFKALGSGVVPRISLIMGPCTGELAVLACMNDFVFMVKNSSFLHLTPAFPREGSEKSGDAWIHANRTGCCDYLAETEEECLEQCRRLLSYLPSHAGEPSSVQKTGDSPDRREEELLNLVPVDSSKPYSMHKLISLVVDRGEILEIRRHWTRNLITAFARLDGRTVGIVANNPQDKGGCMNLDAADKMSRFVWFCDAFNLPLIWLADTPAFLPAVEEETRGLIRHGARMIQVNSAATVPQITVAVRKHYGGGRLSMPGLTLGGDLSVAWPTHEPGLMGAEGAVAIIYRNELKEIQDDAQREERKKSRIVEMRWGIDMGVREATQQIIDPRETRPFLIRALQGLGKKEKKLLQRKHDNFRM